MDLFEYQAAETLDAQKPLAERMRPKSLDGFVGQDHVAGPKGLLRHALDNDRVFSMILWGPPGCGKTTLARIVATKSASYFVHFSAVLSGVKEIRTVIAEAQKQRQFHHKRTILFVDEIHRFNKAQQDAFLHHVESGLITLIGATTENPSFEVIAPLLSRCRVVTLNPLAPADIETIIKNALKDENTGSKRPVDIDAEALAHLSKIADGDARSALNSLEIALALVKGKSEKEQAGAKLQIVLADVETALQQKALRYDKAGEEHFNLISAFHKSLRGSDPDASLYWLMRMLMAGEDPLYVARRMVRFASEDVGNADTNALTVALNAMESFRFLGPPEGELALAQAAIYLACAPKSNRIYAAMKEVQKTIKQTGSPPVPLHIRNAPTGLMANLGYGRGYKYAHDHEEGFAAQSYLPENLKNRRFYHPTERGYEKTIAKRMAYWRNLARQTKENEPTHKPDNTEPK
jgi:putative ATPase